MVEILARKNTETVIGKNVIENIETIERATAEVLKNNLDLRRVENRTMVRDLVEAKLGKKVADESVPRAIRAIQSLPPGGKGLWRPEEDDGRDEREKIHRNYYGKRDFEKEHIDMINKELFKGVEDKK